MRYKGSTYTKHHVNAYGDVVYYCKCEKRKGNNCSCRITVTFSGNITEIGEHGDKCAADNDAKNSIIPHYDNGMMGMVDELAIQNLGWTPRQV